LCTAATLTKRRSCLQVKKTEDCIAFLKSKPKPLAIYAFTNNEKLKQRIVAETSSGSVLFNDAIVQVKEHNETRCALMLR
jgi:acyl-CoA reductase-like NAD-dependent aldehyde dehydrogenase